MVSKGKQKRLAVLTSGGDAPGMNAALRAIVRIALNRGIEPYAVYEGFQGLVNGGEYIRKLNWNDVGGILHMGGTIIGTARSEEFRSHLGRLKAARNLLEKEINNLIVIGGDGSLNGAYIFHQEWTDIVNDLISQGLLSPEIGEKYPFLRIVGLVGSIDNDFFGTDITLGADTALHRITEAIDAIHSTAASHQRSFVVEVMGRNCGYLALMGALATGADWVLIRESPPESDNWEETMCSILNAGRKAGRRDTLVVVAEGAKDKNGGLISSNYVKTVLQEKLGEDVRLTVLGHVQRGGSPSAFDRILGARLGTAAVEEIASPSVRDEPILIGLRGNRITTLSLKECVQKTQEINDAINDRNFTKAMELRGKSFIEAFQVFRTMIRSLPHEPKVGQKRVRLAIVHSGALAPGMNTAVRAAVRLGLDAGHTMLGIFNGFQGFANGQIKMMDWMSVKGWAPRGGSELGTNRKVPSGGDLYAIARNIEEHQIQGLLIIGGFTGYQAAYKMFFERKNYPAFNIPIICMPASINNNLPGSELSLGSDTALNNIINAVDKIKQSAIAERRCFIVEVMGRFCGYLAVMTGLATGAERVYLNEQGVTLKDLQRDLEILKNDFSSGKRLGLLIRNEHANPIYTTHFMCSLFEEEGGDLFDARQVILGHLQRGGDPSPFDRIQATRLASKCIDRLIKFANDDSIECEFIGYQGKEIVFHSLEDFPKMIDETTQRPKQQWWLEFVRLVEDLSHFHYR